MTNLLRDVVVSPRGVQSRREVVVGVTGSGKGVYARVAAHDIGDLRVWVDPMSYQPDAEDVPSFLRALQRLSEDRDTPGRDGWDIVVLLDPEDMPAFARLFVPSDGHHVSVASSFSRGVHLIIDEADLYARAGGKGERAVASLYRRGRHYGVSVMTLTQAPRNIGKEVTSQAERVTAFRLHEPRDLAYLREAAPPIARVAADVWRRPYHAVRYARTRGVVEEVWADEALGVILPRALTDPQGEMPL